MRGRGWLTAVLVFASFLTAQADGTKYATNLWYFTFYSEVHNDEPLSSPAVGTDGTIYVGTFAGRLEAVAPDGTEKWHFQIEREIKSSPAIADDGTIYFGSRDHNLYAITPAGGLKWKFTTGAWVDSSPAITTDGTVYFGSWDKNFYALNPDGSLKWKYAVGSIVDSSPAIALDGTVYFGAHDGKLYALDAAGKLRWTFPTAAEIMASPAIGADGSISINSADGNLYRVQADGKEVWHCRIGAGSDSSPVIGDDGTVAVGVADRVMAVTSAGIKVFDFQFPDWSDSTPAFAHGMICCSAPWRRIWGVTTNSFIVWSTDSLTNNLNSSLVFGGHGEIYCCCGLNLRAIQPPVPLSFENSPWPVFRADARHTGRARRN